MKKLWIILPILVLTFAHAECRNYTVMEDGKVKLVMICD